VTPGVAAGAHVRHGTVTHLPSARVYAVKDTHGCYLVTLLVQSALCSCRAGGDCTHTQTAQRQARADQRAATTPPASREVPLPRDRSQGDRGLDGRGRRAGRDQRSPAGAP